MAARSWYHFCGQRRGCCIRWVLCLALVRPLFGRLKDRFYHVVATKRPYRETQGYSGRCYKWGQCSRVTFCLYCLEIYRHIFFLSFFLILFQLLFIHDSMFFGNLFVYFQFQGKNHIDEATRTLVFSVLIGVGILGFFFLTALRPIGDTRVVNGSDNEADDELESSSNGVIIAFKNSINLFFTREMLLLSLTFFYTGKLFKWIINAEDVHKQMLDVNYFSLR